jgi:GNAT superfamily N-acetyltransferase
MLEDFGTVAMEITQFLPVQYEALAQILSAAYPGYMFDAGGLRSLDANLADGYVARRWIGSQDGIPVAVGEYRHTPEMFHPREFLLLIAVHPAYQGQGIGRRLYQCIHEDMAAHDPLKIRAACQASHMRSVAFLERRGFARGKHILELQLDLERLETVKANNHLDGVSVPGVTITTLSALAKDPVYDRKLYELITALRAEVPLPRAATRVSFEHFVADFLVAPSRLPEATWVAIHDGEYVGFSDLFEDGEGGLYCGLTGVLPLFRGRGLAKMLKSTGVDFAYSHGYRHIRTFNDDANAAILAVNRRLGYAEKSAWLHFEKTIDGP